MTSTARLRGWSLGTKFIFFSVFLTASAVCLAFILVSASIRDHTKSLLANTLARRQQTIVKLQSAELARLLRMSALMTDSPTLRAAMETYSYESRFSSGSRSDLLETIQLEVERVAAGLGRDLFVVTDSAGQVLATGGDRWARFQVGQSLASHSTIRRAMESDTPVSEANLSVIKVGGSYFRVGSVPIALQGYLIGTLTIGDRVDERFTKQLQDSFDGDFMIVAGGRVVGSTLDAGLQEHDLVALAGSIAAGKGATIVVKLAGSEYVAAGLSLGTDDTGDNVELFLLNSLTAALGDWSRPITGLVTAWLIVSMVLVGLAAWRLSGTVLRPLWDFVGFMRAVATTGDHARRFHCASACVEVETLNDTYNQLMDSLIEHERRWLQRARDELDRLERLKESEKLASLGRMLSGVAHEINNPLTGVIGNLELLLQQNLDPETRNRLGTIRQQAQHVVALSRNLLKTCHRETGERSLVDIRKALREAADVRRHDFVNAGMQLDLELDSEPILVLGSELELHQVFLNIINNAFDALEEGKSSGRLTIRARPAGDRVNLTFADNGPGIGNPRQIFEHFYTTKGVSKGTGLGLSICRSIVQRHGGEIFAENGEIHGACFVVDLPLAPHEHTASLNPPVTTTPSPQVASSERLSASVLVVDDESTIVDLQKEILHALGAEVVGVASGEAAIEVLLERSFDIIVTDLRMPGAVSGKQLYRWVGSNMPALAQNFLFVSGDIVGAETREFISTTGARHLAKPFAVDDYVRVLRQVHENRYAPQ